MILCARGFKEEQNFRTDSATCSREGLHLTCSMIASSKWTLNSLDVKTAFLHGKAIERTVYVRPLKEANTSQVWKLQKCVYGLADASKHSLVLKIEGRSYQIESITFDT